MDLNVAPVYRACSFCQFQPGEKHVDGRPQSDSLVMLLGGTLRYFEDGRHMQLCAGEWALQRAGRLYEGREASGEPHLFYVRFEGAYTTRRVGNLPMRGTFPVEETLGALRRAQEAEQCARTLTERTRLFYDLLGALLPDEPAAGAWAEVERMRQTIGQNFQKGLLVRDIAEQFGYSEDYVIRLFKRCLGVTPHRYIGALKLGFAQQLLLTTGRRLQEVAVESGFSDTSALFRAFVQETGLSPGAWRRRNLSSSSQQTEEPV